MIPKSSKFENMAAKQYFKLDKHSAVSCISDVNAQVIFFGILTFLSFSLFF